MGCVQSTARQKCHPQAFTPPTPPARPQSASPIRKAFPSPVQGTSRLQELSLAASSSAASSVRVERKEWPRLLESAIDAPEEFFDIFSSLPLHEIPSLDLLKLSYLVLRASNSELKQKVINTIFQGCTDSKRADLLKKIDPSQLLYLIVFLNSNLTTRIKEDIQNQAEWFTGASFLVKLSYLLLLSPQELKNFVDSYLLATPSAERNPSSSIEDPLMYLFEYMENSLFSERSEKEKSSLVENISKWLFQNQAIIKPGHHSSAFSIIIRYFFQTLKETTENEDKFKKQIIYHSKIAENASAPSLHMSFRMLLLKELSYLICLSTYGIFLDPTSSYLVARNLFIFFKCTAPADPSSLDISDIANNFIESLISSPIVQRNELIYLIPLQRQTSLLFCRVPFFTLQQFLSQSRLSLQDCHYIAQLHQLLPFDIESRRNIHAFLFLESRLVFEEVGIQQPVSALDYLSPTAWHQLDLMFIIKASNRLLSPFYLKSLCNCLPLHLLHLFILRKTSAFIFSEVATIHLLAQLLREAEVKIRRESSQLKLGQEREYRNQLTNVYFHFFYPTHHHSVPFQFPPLFLEIMGNVFALAIQEKRAEETICLINRFNYQAAFFIEHINPETAIPDPFFEKTFIMEINPYHALRWLTHFRDKINPSNYSLFSLIISKCDLDPVYVINYLNFYFDFFMTRYPSGISILGEILSHIPLELQSNYAIAFFRLLEPIKFDRLCNECYFMDFKDLLLHIKAINYR